MKDGTQLDTGVELTGVPFDATSTYRPGSRFGPAAIREAFRNVEVYVRSLDLDLESAEIRDAGDLGRTANLDQMFTAVRDAIGRIRASGRVPGLLGGEHTITFPAMIASPPNTALLIFDAHLDLRPEYEGLPTMHATWLRRLLEQRPDVKVVHVGARAGTRPEWEFAGARRINLVGPDEISSDGTNPALNPLLGASSTYISIDLDVLDPAYAPGVANPEVDGLSTHQLLGLLRQLQDIDLCGFDIVELAPPFDPSSITAVAAASTLVELCRLSFQSTQRELGMNSPKPRSDHP